ncbi:NAD(P)-dependent oxidoreductase [Ktedonosporobacter rubrisoli]|uniref:NAD(P)-dependent oxidoreductase n=1 Tax=Ktedonosporobacter rubrisoli TaxID=2509675 RepID=A0A4P6JTI3_KTERU|nr:NAD(P)-dependent oxidoreductase [Ktedonosporobacter rubrisoli]QBD78754.1 NAD(P)-dependent oxidoreductase [Ktedonosporobacter rubrisoli]
MRVLITGSSGRLGAAIAARLAGQHEPIGLDLVAGPWTHYVRSVQDKRAIAQIVKQVDAIIHTASLHQPQLATHSPAEFIAINVTGTHNLIEAAAASGIQRFIYTSTTSLYGHALAHPNEAVWVTEKLQLRPRDIYDSTKITAEKLCLQLAARLHIPVTCLRISRFFPEEPRTQAIHRLYRGVDLHDAATAHVLALTKPDLSSDIFNIAARSPFQKSDTPLLLRNAPEVLRHRVPDIEATFARLDWSLPQSIDRVYVIEKAERLLGYQPRYNFHEHLQQQGYL